MSSLMFSNSFKGITLFYDKTVDCEPEGVSLLLLNETQFTEKQQVGIA